MPWKWGVTRKFASFLVGYSSDFQDFVYFSAWFVLISHCLVNNSWSTKYPMPRNYLETKIRRHKNDIRTPFCSTKAERWVGLCPVRGARGHLHSEAHIYIHTHTRGHRLIAGSFRQPTLRLVARPDFNSPLWVKIPGSSFSAFVVLPF